MSKQITATGIATVTSLDHGVTAGTPYQDHESPDQVTYTFETATTRIAVEGTPAELRQLAADIVAQVDAHETLTAREAS